MSFAIARATNEGKALTPHLGASDGACCAPADTSIAGWMALAASTADALLAALAADSVQSEHRRCSGPCRRQRPTCIQVQAFVSSCFDVRLEAVAAASCMHSFRLIVLKKILHRPRHIKSTPAAARRRWKRRVTWERRPWSNMVPVTAEQRLSSLNAPAHATLAKFSVTMSINDDTGKLL